MSGVSAALRSAPGMQAGQVSRAQGKPQGVFPASVDAYALGAKIGLDSRSDVAVHEAECIPLGSAVAIKRVDLEREGSLARVTKEVACLRQSIHPNVMPLHVAFVAGGNLWLVLPFHAGGSCTDLLHRGFPRGLEEPAVLAVARDTCCGLAHLHSQGVLHRQLQPSNLLVDADGTVRLSGLCLTVRAPRKPRLNS